MRILKKIYLFSNKFFTRADFFCLYLIWFMFIVILGTIYQKDVGIKHVKQYIFESNIIWINNFIPIPGGKIILILILLGLFFKFINENWSIKKIGLILIHFGVMFLILSSFISFKYSEYGHLIIYEGENINKFISDDNYILLISHKNKNESINLNEKNKFINFKNLKIEIKNIFYNCKLSHKNNFSSNEDGILKYFNIENLPFFVEEEQNKACVILNFYKNNIFLYKIAIFEDTSLNFKTKFLITLKKQRINLPFNINLISFKKICYPGTKIAKNYSSKLIIKDKNNKIMNYEIIMNKPLRYKFYTFYQTSFIEKDEKKATVLTVVKNFARTMPYYSCLILFIGFFLHLIIYVKTLKKSHA
jgi:hypothetical protein